MLFVLFWRKKEEIEGRLTSRLAISCMKASACSSSEVPALLPAPAPFCWEDMWVAPELR